MPRFNNTWPRYTIFLTDALVCLFSIILAYELRFNFRIPSSEYAEFGIGIAFLFVVRIATFFIFSTYTGMIQYTSSEDAVRIFFTATIGTLFVGVSNFVTVYFSNKYLVPFSILIIDYFIAMFLMMGFRVAVKMFVEQIEQIDKVKSTLFIYGVDKEAVITKHTLENDTKKHYKVLGFFDDTLALANQKIEGVNIYNTGSDLDRMLKDYHPDQLIITKQITPQKRNEIVDKCLKYHVKVLQLPPVSDWINGELNSKQIRELKIEELLERDPIQLDIETIRGQIEGKKILITGAAGSIGSEIIRQLAIFKPKQLILLDQAESALFELNNELAPILSQDNYEIVIGDVRNEERMENLFTTFRPEIVYHAAAYKHVPLMEDNPSEAILTNVLGTKICADLAVKCGTEKFVFVSTDKAVNPTSVMGASKRIAEIYVQSLNYNAGSGLYHTRFITTRFGNVLGSNGSVIPLFRKQLAVGGPLTVTDPEVTRFFMTIPEACRLVLEAGAIGQGGEIFIFDMGEPVKIIELAKKMIQLSGFEPEDDIKIVYTGLRPGEKLYEELLNTQENSLPTHHPKIMIAKVQEYPFKKINADICELIALFANQNNTAIVSKMKDIVPEFKSNNSVFQKLDKERSF